VQDNELLILGENIEYSFLNINEAEKLNTILIDEKRTLQCACPNWHKELFWIFAEYAPEGERKIQLFKEKGRMYTSREEAYNEFESVEIDFIRDNLGEDDVYYGDEFLDIDYVDLKKRFEISYDDEKIERIRKYYGVAEYIYSAEASKNKINDFHKLKYEDKDIIDFDKYTPTSKSE